MKLEEIVDLNFIIPSKKEIKGLIKHLSDNKVLSFEDVLILNKMKLCKLLLLNIRNGSVYI